MLLNRRKASGLCHCRHCLHRLWFRCRIVHVFLEHAPHSIVVPAIDHVDVSRRVRHDIGGGRLASHITIADDNDNVRAGQGCQRFRLLDEARRSLQVRRRALLLVMDAGNRDGNLAHGRAGALAVISKVELRSRPPASNRATNSGRAARCARLLFQGHTLLVAEAACAAERITMGSMYRHAMKPRKRTLGRYVIRHE